MKTINLKTFAALYIVVLLAACSTIQPGHDALIVRAQQIRSALPEIVEVFSLYEFNNREKLWHVSHSFKHAADAARMHLSKTVAALDKAIDTYRALKSPIATSALLEQIRSADSLLTQSTSALTDAKAVMSTVTP